MKPTYEPNIEYVGSDDKLFMEKPENSLTHEEITYLYADHEDYTYIGRYQNTNGKIERLYTAN